MARLLRGAEGFGDGEVRADQIVDPQLHNGIDGRGRARPRAGCIAGIAAEQFLDGLLQPALGVEEELAAGDDEVAVGETGENLHRSVVARKTESNQARVEPALAEGDHDDLARAAVDHGLARDDDGRLSAH